jgi:hypothetical protein
MRGWLQALAGGAMRRLIENKDVSVITRVVTVAGGRFAPGHLGEPTQQVPFEMDGRTCWSAQRLSGQVDDLMTVRDLAHPAAAGDDRQRLRERPLPAAHLVADGARCP